MRNRIFWLAALLLSASSVFAQKPQPKNDTTLRYPIKDRRGDRFTWQNRNPFDLRDTAFIRQTIEYDPVTRQYYIVEKIGNQVYRRPTYLTFEEFYKIRAQQQEAEYFRKRANALTALNRKVERPKFKLFNNLFNRIMGADSTGKVKIDIRPQGNVDIMAGYQGQNIKNPTLPERARRNGGFDFDMNANLNVIANIGEKLKLPINYNTLANFDFENQLKLDYKGLDDEIIKSIEAGNINWQSKGTLIPSTQGLFGLKTQLQFGKLFVTTALANQKSTRQSMALQGGAATTQFQKRLDDYEENRHFLLAGHFRDNYNNAMSQLPRVNSQVQIMRMEVWVTNRTGATTDARDIVGLSDLGESGAPGSRVRPDNSLTPVYSTIANNPSFRQPSQATSLLLGLGLRQVTDFEKTFARKLNPNEYYFNPQVGWISLNQQLQPDEVLAVAYQYTYNGKVFQVGEFSQDLGLDSTNGVQKVLYLKLLKATSQRIPSLLWDLMMKNVYSLDVASIQPTDFKLNLMYEEPSKGLKRYLPQSDPAYEGVPLLRIVNLDRLNNRLDPQPDGVFDYVEGFTVLSQQGKIIFPVLEPLGADLQRIAMQSLPQNIRDSFSYPELYDTIKAIAQTYANKNRFLFQGQVKGSGGSEIYLGAFNVPQGSVSVTAGGQILTENVDYTVDYNLGSVKIINQAILNSGVPVNVQFENNAGFGIQQRNFLGLRLDYLASKKLSIGGSMVRLSERPFFTKMNYGEDPIRNTMYGVDFSYRSPWPGLTRMLDKLPFYSTTASSNVTAYGEAAYLKPGHAPQIGKGGEGLIYLDDFEGSRNNIDLRFPWVAWTLASTPAAFPEASRFNDTTYGINRAKLAWYNIEPILQDRTSNDNPLRRNTNELSDPRVRLVNTTELFKNRTPNLGQSQTVTFDMAYYPAERGPYNFETDPSVINAEGKYFAPLQRRRKWGGIMRSLDQTDFETGNIEFIEFWVQDPFIKNANPLASGKLMINLGNVSEDVLKDGRRFYENGLPTPQIPAQIDSSSWGYQPINPIQITQAFSNDPDDRPFQDVGFDGMTDGAEIRRHSDYLTKLATTFGTNSAVYRQAAADPSNDNYIWYRDEVFNSANVGILGRYKNYNNPQGNSPVASTSSQFSSAATLYPDNEDLNRDNTLNENEEYYEYEIPLSQNMPISNYIVDKRNVSVNYANGTSGSEIWYQFRVPVKGYTRRIGSIPDFKSIRFMRMYLTDFEDSVVMRFASLDLVRNQWRTFNYALDTVGRYTPASTTPLLVSAVNIEENSGKNPVNYVIPCGIERVQYLSNNNVNLLQNEQAMSLQVRGISPRDAKAVFKTLNLDLRQYGQLSMFVHAESIPGFANLDNDQLYAVIRIGQDFLSNYYEIRYPLKVTKPGTYNSSSCDSVWPVANNLDFDMQELINLKTRRNGSLFSVTKPYREKIGNKTFTVFGNPNLGEVRGLLFGIENAHSDPVSGEVWINELRLSRLDETGGYAALGRVDVQLADLGTLTVSGNTYTKGFGTLEQRVNERARDNMYQFDVAANIDAGKLLPKEARLSIPVYASINRTVRTPEYDPYDLDIKLKDKMNAYSGKRDSIRDAAIDQTTIKTLNFTNVRIQPKGTTKLWSISNLDVSYSYTKFEQTNPLILKNDVIKHRGGLGYTYNSTPKYIEPLKKIRSKTPWLSLVRDINFNLNPSLLSFRADVNRQFGEFVPRIVSDGKIDRVDTTYDKYFTFDRFYNLRWDLTRSLNIDFSAINNARVDEPYGRLNTKEKKDTVRTNFWNGGRNTLYNQKATAAYTLPLGKLPLTDWITARYTYGTSYSWIGASRLAIDLGNTLENTQENAINGEFDFTRLYQKSRWLRALDMPAQPKQKETKDPNGKKKIDLKKQDGIPDVPSRAEVIKGKTGNAKKEALAKWREQKRAAKIAKNNQPVEVSGIMRVTGKVLTMVKRASVNYSENYYSRIPGYMDSTKFLGQNWKTMAPGLDYVFGKQPDTAWLNKQAAKGLITRSKDFNFLYQQRFEQKLTITAQIEPISELMIDLNVEKSFNKNYSELYKDTFSTSTPGRLSHNNPLSAGGFNVSYIAFKTLFEKFKPNEVSETFNKFQEYRQIISQRVAEQNPYWKQSGSPVSSDGYAAGYGRYSQDVLIPAFIAAYTGKSPHDVALLKQNNPNIKSNPFRSIMPKPNWKLTYTGLTKIPALAKTFSTISITHGYTGNLSMNQFTSALLFQDPFYYAAPGFIDPISGNYVPYFLVPNITIQEQFAPLIGVDVTTTSQMNIRGEYRKSRQLSLSLIDYQLSELNSTEWTFGFSYRTKNITLPFKLPFMKDKKLENDLNFRLDLSMRDDAQSNSRLDQANAYSTGGQKVITIQPSIDYVLNNRLNLKLFFDQRRVTPYVSTSAPIVNTRAGLQLRIALAQ